MARSRRLELVGLVSAIGFSALGTACGGSTAAPASEPGASAALAAPAGPAEGPEEKCFALANAQRSKKPGEPDTIQVSHVLVKHTGSKNAPAGVERTRGAACLRALEVRDKLIAGADFDITVSDYSDEPGAASRAGSLGQVHRADVLPAFADAAFELDRGQLSDVVETEFGFHVILRTE
jgi:hypothetical protein